MSTFSKIRELTISSMFCKGQWKTSLKPKLTLSGDWMKKAGFEIGDKVSVSVKNETITIKILKS